MKHISEHKDLAQFEEKYNKKIEEFLNSKSETKVVFLNADFGLGKTTFIEENLNIDRNCIYSPWLNSSNNYLEEIYFHVTKKNKGKLSSWSLFISSVILIFSVLAGSIISVFADIFKSDSFICRFNKANIVCHSDDSLVFLVIIIIIFVSILIFIIFRIIFKRPVPIINFFKKENGKYYDDRIIEKILENVPKVLVIEDIDRTDDIEDILLAANKISKYIIEKNLQKYVLVTGDYVRTIRRLSEPNIYDVQNYNIALLRSKGVFLVDKVISLRIDFCTLEGRVRNVLDEYHVTQKLEKIEFDELISFMHSHYLSIRFFVKFLESELKMINQNNNIYYLFVEYFNNQKYFNIEDKRRYDISSKIPSCLNDIEMFYQCRSINIRKIEIKNIFDTSHDSSNRSIIVDCFKRILTFDNYAVDIFQEFYNTDIYPQLATDRASNPDSVVMIGGTLKPNNLKNDLDNFLIGISNYENGIMGTSFNNKRCYFDVDYNTNNYESYKINSVLSSKTKVVNTDTFLIAYIACFLRDNKTEIETNYPGINTQLKRVLSKKVIHEDK